MVYEENKLENSSFWHKVNQIITKEQNTKINIRIGSSIIAKL
jgi:hypothetical protein